MSQKIEKSDVDSSVQHVSDAIGLAGHTRRREKKAIGARSRWCCDTDIRFRNKAR